MNKKLTLSIDKFLIEKAKLYAQKKGRSLSDIIENYLKVITSDEQEVGTETYLVKKLRGSFKAPVSNEYKKDLSDELAKKYGL